MAHKKDSFLSALRLMALVAATLPAALSLSACTGGPATNGNSNGNSNLNSNANSNSGAVAATDQAAFSTREPERYSLTMTVSAQGEASGRQGSAPPLQFNLAKLGADRRWSFQLPQPLGQVTYLEKAGLKYLILPSRNEYVELRSDELGFPIGNLMTPTMAIDQLKSRAPQAQNLGTETVNGRTAVKYRFAGATDTRTQAGTAQADSLVYVDQETGLPLRAEIYASTTSGANARVVTETRDIQLNPDPTVFDVPAGMKKVTSAELKQQVQGFVQALQIFAQMMRQQAGAPPPPPPAPGAPQPAANTNGNANRP